MRGSATLAVVAPGISEALIATAAGLAAAIPAVVAYNYYINRIKVLNCADGELFLGIAEHHRAPFFEIVNMDGFGKKSLGSPE